MSRFPKLTETFILYEMLAVEQQGVRIALYPLMRERTAVIHAEAARMLPRAHFVPLLSWAILRAQWYFLLRAPRTYFGAVGALCRGTWGSLRYFTGGLALFPKAVLFARMMQEEGVTHLHAHFASHPAAAAFVIHRLTGIPYSFTAHGSDLHRDRHMLREKVSEAAFVVAISDFNKELIVSECGERFRRKVEVIHCGVDNNMLCPRHESTSSERDGRPPNILCIGTLHEVKGQTHLIEACRMLARRGLSVTCHLVGDGPDREMLDRQVRRAKLEAIVQFHGRLNHDEVARLLQQADLVVAPSVPSRDGRREGIPVALMEAMAAGVPVVASNLSGIPELVEDNGTGLLVRPGDARALSLAIQRLLLDPPLRCRLALAARDKVVREFDLPTNAALLAQRFTTGVYA